MVFFFFQPDLFVLPLDYSEHGWVDRRGASCIELVSDVTPAEFVQKREEELADTHAGANVAGSVSAQRFPLSSHLLSSGGISRAMCSVLGHGPIPEEDSRCYHNLLSSGAFEHALPSAQGVCSLALPLPAQLALLHRLVPQHIILPLPWAPTVPP